MAVYQVAVIFEAESDKEATLLAETLSGAAASAETEKLVASPKIAFTKYEQEVEVE